VEQSRDRMNFRHFPPSLLLPDIMTTFLVYRPITDVSH